MQTQQTQWTVLTALPLLQCPHHYKQTSAPSTSCVPGWCSKQGSPTAKPKPSQPAHSDTAQGFNSRPTGLKSRFFSCRGFLRAPSQRALL